MATDEPLLTELNERSREIFRHIVDAYMDTGEPIGSRTLSRRLSEKISPATVRNVMADLEELGLLAAPHISAGRMPTEMGLRLFVSGLMEVGDLPIPERSVIEKECLQNGQSLETMLNQATARLAGLSRCASLVMVPTKAAALKHIEFVSLSPGRALAVMVDQADNIENRYLEVPEDLPSSALVEASNYVNSRIAGRTLDEARLTIERERADQQQLLDQLSSKVVEAGVAAWAGGEAGSSLIVKGHSNLLNDVTTLEQLEEIRSLLGALEAKGDALDLLAATGSGEGVQIFIGSENKMFEGAGLSMIVSPYQNMEGSIIGAIGVVGPTRINYARIIPMVDYTAKMIGRIIG